MEKTVANINSGLIVRSFAGKTATRSELLNFCKANGISAASLDGLDHYRNTNNTYDFPEVAPPVATTEVSGSPESDGVRAHRHVRSIASDGYYIPTPRVDYVASEHFDDIRKLIRSKKFLPTMMTGLSGTGKTRDVTEACAVEGRELILVSITSETNEEDLMGSIGLVDGDTILNEGPVTTAMRRGAVLCLDEADYGGSKLAAVQNILNGGSYTFKKTGEVVRAAPGFMVFATMNTKGKGSETGQFAFTNVMNEAFLDRFPICLEYSYPTMEREVDILKHHTTDMGFISLLTKWADKIRVAFNNGDVEETMSTRRLINICQMFEVYGDKNKAVAMGISRFNKDLKSSFMLWFDALVDESNGKPKQDTKNGPKTANPF